MDRERVAYLTLALTPGVGAARLATLLSACGTAIGVLSAPFAFLSALPGFSKAAATEVAGRSLREAEQLLEAVERLGGTVLVPDDPHFPRQ
ncbi:MAG TPA: hypothetical protein VK672_05415, partial [Solirubrobacteraceae bacterium]|nr:hypothetical protein [Solirubrobacteraceae bacterium]